MLATLPKWGPEFHISLDVFFNSITSSQFSNVIQFTDSGYDEWPTPVGYRIPIISTKDDGKLIVGTQIDDKGHVGFYGTISTETWYKIEIEQKKNHKGEVKKIIACHVWYCVK